MSKSGKLGDDVGARRRRLLTLQKGAESLWVTVKGHSRWQGVQPSGFPCVGEGWGAQPRSAPPGFGFLPCRALVSYSSWLFSGRNSGEAQDLGFCSQGETIRVGLYRALASGRQEPLLRRRNALQDAGCLVEPHLGAWAETPGRAGVFL